MDFGGDIWRGSRAAFLAVTGLVLVWAGLLVGVSFLATPVKFMAPDLSLAVALEVGRVTFRALNWVELGFGVVAVVLSRMAGGRLLTLALVLVLALVVAQTVWLLPVLGERTDIVVAGGTLPPSSLHSWYVAFEVAKLLALLAIGIIGLMRGTSIKPSER